MSCNDESKTTASKVEPLKRTYAASVKAIMYSRRANTRRNPNKQRRIGPWIGDTIVVKLYDQMDSLREVLDFPARIYSVKAKEKEKGVLDKKSGTQLIEDAQGKESGVISREGKRKRDESEDVVSDCESPSVPDIKRRKVMS